MWSLDSVTDRPPVTGTANCNSSDGEERRVGDNFDGTDPLLGLVALQLTVLVIISALGTFANALVFAVFYRRPSLRTISNRFVLTLFYSLKTMQTLERGIAQDDPMNQPAAVRNSGPGKSSLGDISHPG